MSQFDRPTVRALLDLMSIEGCDFAFKESADIGWIRGTIFFNGDADRYRGEELQADFVTGGRRGTGFYRVNEAGVVEILRKLEQRAAIEEGAARG